MEYDATRQTVRFKAYRVPARCWRCWKTFTFFTPYEFVDMMVFRCERCGAKRVIEAYGEGNYGGAESKYIDFHYSHLPRNEDEKHMDEFLRVFEGQWTDLCPCGGHFRFRSPIRCPHCRAPECRLLRGRDEIVESPPIPVLKFAIPPEYTNAPARPSWQPKAKA